MKVYCLPRSDGKVMVIKQVYENLPASLAFGEHDCCKDEFSHYAQVICIGALKFEKFKALVKAPPRGTNYFGKIPAKRPGPPGTDNNEERQNERLSTKTCLKRYKQATIRKMRNQKEIPTPKPEVGKTI